MSQDAKISQIGESGHHHSETTCADLQERHKKRNELEKSCRVTACTTCKKEIKYKWDWFNFAKFGQRGQKQVPYCRDCYFEILERS